MRTKLYENWKSSFYFWSKNCKKLIANIKNKSKQLWNTTEANPAEKYILKVNYREH